MNYSVSNMVNKTDVAYHEQISAANKDK